MFEIFFILLIIMVGGAAFYAIIRIVLGIVFWFIGLFEDEQIDQLHEKAKAKIEKDRLEEEKRKKGEYYKLKKFDAVAMSLADYYTENPRVQLFYGGHANQIRKYRSKIISTIKNNFVQSRCKSCNEPKHKLIRFNSDNSAGYFSCITCGTSIWLKSIDRNPVNNLMGDLFEYEKWHNKLEKLSIHTGLEKGTSFSAKFSSGESTETKLRARIEPEDWNRELVIELDGEIAESEKKRSRYISQKIRDKVWNRDGGRCTECGSNEFLEFDHIVPFSKGGSNTERNIQLLCESCNRNKSGNIG